MLILLRLPVTLRARLDAHALVQHVSCNDFVLAAINEKLLLLERATSQPDETPEPSGTAS